MKRLYLAVALMMAIAAITPDVTGLPTERAVLTIGVTNELLEQQITVCQALFSKGDPSPEKIVFRQSMVDKLASTIICVVELQLVDSKTIELMNRIKSSSIRLHSVSDEIHFANERAKYLEMIVKETSRSATGQFQVQFSGSSQDLETIVDEALKTLETRP